jgi:hypothetical protein
MNYFYYEPIEISADVSIAIAIIIENRRNHDKTVSAENFFQFE